MIPCYNRGCGQDYDPENNPEGEWLSLFGVNLAKTINGFFFKS